jgi:polyhydroxybutyrate depolymerase
MSAIHRLVPSPLVLALASALGLAPCRTALAQTEPQAPQAPQAPPAEPGPNVPELDAALARLAQQLSLGGAGLAVGLGAERLHLGTVGQFTADQVLPIASASKWLAVATVLTLVDDGTVDLDLPLSRYLTEFDRPDKNGLTLRQCLSCTAGFPARLPAVRDPDLDMDGMAAALAEQPLRGEPGLEFQYGGATFEAAACVAVRCTGRDWHTLFKERIGAPLGLSSTAFGRLAPPGAASGEAKAPWVAGGAVSTLRDYDRFVRMLANGGELDGVRVLRPESVELMFHSCTDGMTVRAPGLDGELAYGLGTWLQRLDDGVVRGSDPGAFGFLPWIDRDRGICGVIAGRDRIGRVRPRAAAVQAAARQYVASAAVSGRDEVVHLEHGGRDRRYLLHTPPFAERALKLPLMVVLHGGGGNGAQVARSTRFSELADREDFVVVYPDGTGLLRSKLLTWNSGGIQVYASEHDVDDVAFLKAVVADVARRVAIDPERVYATGMSNGGMMCHRLARQAADVFAAVAPVSGAMDFTDADAATPIAVMIVHGTADRMVPYAGGRPDRHIGRAGNRVDASVAAAVAYYRARNGLAGEPSVEVDGKVRIENWSRAGANGASLRVVTIDGGGHAWPGAARAERAGADTPAAWDATAAIWAFCKEARRN